MAQSVNPHESCIALFLVGIAPRCDWRQCRSHLLIQTLETSYSRQLDNITDRLAVELTRVQQSHDLLLGTIADYVQVDQLSELTADDVVALQFAASGIDHLVVFDTDRNIWLSLRDRKNQHVVHRH